MTESLFTVQTPALGDNSDGTPGIATATTIQFLTAGNVTGIRFYATATVYGTYTAEIWEVTSDDSPDNTGTGTLLATKVMVGSPTAATWNVVPFDSPVAVTPTTKIYRCVIHNNAGRYVATLNFWTGFDLTNGNLKAWHHGDDTVGFGSQSQGAFKINATAGVYPNSGGGGTNYFVDVTFEAAGATQNVAPPSIGSAEAWGTPTVQVGVATVTPTAIPTAESWGTPTLTSLATVAPSGIGSGESWGTPVVTAGAAAVIPPSIPSGESWGNPTIFNVGQEFVAPGSIPSGEAWGTPMVTKLGHSPCEC